MKQILFTILLLSFFSIEISAQITSSELKGTVIDSENNIIPSAYIKIVHIPTGSVHQTVSSINGNFYIPQLKPGGPYSLQVKFIGFSDFFATDIYLKLGEKKGFDVIMKEENIQLEGVVIEIDKDDLLSNKQTNKKEQEPILDLMLLQNFQQ